MDEPRTRADRMPLLPDSALTREQRAAVHQVSIGPRGGIFGPFVPLLRSPGAMTHLQQLGAYLRFESPLPRELFEMAILLTARFRDQEFEWTFHAPLARAAGVSEPVIDAISRGVEPTGLDARVRAAYRLIVGSLRDNEINDATYHAAVAHWGTQCVIDLVATVGYYTTLAMVMNLAQTPAPESAPDLAAFRSGGILRPSAAAPTEPSSLQR